MANKYENNILDAIETIVDNAVANAQYDKTIQATIVECVDQTIGQFKVKYQDSTFYAYAISSDVTYSKGKSVYVLVPGNNSSAHRTILGAVEKLGVDYAVNPDRDEAYEIVGANTIFSKEIFELCSYRDTKVILYSSEDKDNAKITIDEKAMKEYFKESSHLICGANFKTSLPKEQQEQGNFGIGFDLVFKNNADGSLVTRNYIVDINQMIGNPYQILKETRQYGIYEIDGTNFDHIESVYIFDFSFPNKEKEGDIKPSDIFITNIDFCGATQMDIEKLQLN